MAELYTNIKQWVSKRYSQFMHTCSMNVIYMKSCEMQLLLLCIKTLKDNTFKQVTTPL